MKILFMGRKSVSAKALDYLSKIKGIEVVGVLTDSHLSVSLTTDVAEKLGYKIYSFEEALTDLKNGVLEFDLGISILYWKKLKDEFLTKPLYGTINFHPAPLPEYKGTGGYNLAILDGLNEWAVSCHYVDEEIDTGEIIEVYKFPICNESETVVTLEKTSTEKIYELFVKTFQKFFEAKEKLPTIPNFGGRYVSRKEMEAMKAIQPGDDISRKVRAFWFPPYDGAHIEMAGEKYTLVNREILNSLADPSSSSLFTESS